MRDEPGRTDRCLAVLLDGPATTSEVCVATGIGSKSAGPLLASAHKQGRVLKRWFKKFHCDDGDDYSDVVLWVLPEHAAAWPEQERA
jgi:hypothetical protein